MRIDVETLTKALELADADLRIGDDTTTEQYATVVAEEYARLVPAEDEVWWQCPVCGDTGPHTGTDGHSFHPGAFGGGTLVVPADDDPVQRAESSVDWDSAAERPVVPAEDEGRLPPWDACTQTHAKGTTHYHLHRSALAAEDEGRLRKAADAALTDFIAAHGSDFDADEWPGMAWLRHLLAATPETT